MGLGLRRGTVALEPHDPEWEIIAQQTITKLHEILQGCAADIQHIGSTAIREIAAKPIIDIDVVIKDYSVFDAVVHVLEEIGYHHEGDLGITGREAFTYRGKEHLQKHHLYVCPQDSAELRRHIAFRNYLSIHPEAVREYSRIKEEGAALYPNDIEKYIQHKSPFIEKIYREIGV